MLSIKDYIKLKEILIYLDNEKDREIKENNGFANEPVNRLTKMTESLGEIIYKLETED